MMQTTDIAHLLLRPLIAPGDLVIDATIGNGHDTAWLAGLVGPEGRVIGFDIQESAIEAAGARVAGLPQVTLIQDGHENMTTHIPLERQGQVAAVMFNLGFRPGGAKDVTTRAETTLKALQQALGLVRIDGAVSLLVYSGHPRGADEAEAVRAFAQSLPTTFAASYHARLNTQNAAPELIMIERRR